MMHDETRRKLRELNLEELIQYVDIHLIDSQSLPLSFDERFQLMIDYLYQEKYNHKITRLLTASKLRLPKAELNDIHFLNRGIDKQLMIELGTCQFMDTKMNIVFHGFTGSGKTYLACVLGKQHARLHGF